MAIKSWTGQGGTDSNNWSNGTDWTGGNSVPVSGDDVFLNQTLGGAYIVTLDVTEPTTGIGLNSLTVSNANATLGLSALTKTLTVHNAGTTALTTLSAGKINISNTSTLATDLFTVSGGTFTESNGKLSVIGAGSTALSVTSGSFSESGGAASVTNGASFTGGTGAISGGTFNAGSLTVGGGALTLSGGTTTSTGATTLTSGSVTINSTGTLVTGSLAASGGTFSESAGKVTDSGAASFTGGTEAISGGTFNAASLAVGGGAATLSGGTTTVTGATTLTSGSVTINNAAGTLATGTFAESGTGSFTESNGKLSVTGAGATALSVSAGTFSESGGAVAVTNGASFTGGTEGISGGTFNAGSLAVGGGAATLSGGTTTVTGATTLTSGSLIINNAAGTLSTGSLAVSGGTFTESAGKVTDSGAASFTGGTDTISGGTFTAGTLTVGGASTVLTLSGGTVTTSVNDDTSNSISGSDKISLAGGVLDFTNGGAATSGGVTDNGTVSGKGTLKGTLTGTGQVTASGGTLDLTSDLTAGSTLLGYDITNNASSVLRLDGSVASGAAITFDGGVGGLALNDFNAGTNSLQFNGTIVGGMTVGSGAGSKTNYIDVKQTTVTDAGLSADGHTLTLKNGSGIIDTISLTGAGDAGAFANWTTDGSGGSFVFLSDTKCFVAGTHILTATGERMVETLLQGDIALTLASGEVNAQPVKWLGQRRIDLTAHPHPETVAPIRIRRGAFADAMPRNDLLVSPDHAIFVDGKLIAARQLVNGTTIRQEEGWTSVEYFHVELDTHAILLAEGLPAESYLDTGGRGFFANSGEPLVLHPDLTDESDYPTRAAGSCEPFVTDEASVRPVWQRLSERAAVLGQPAPTVATTTDPSLHIVAAGRTIRPIYQDGKLCIFPLPRNASSVRLASRAGAPTETRPWLDDRRRLGVQVTRIVLRNASEVREIPVDHPDLREGWWAVERDGIALRRWTDGAAALPLPAMGGPTMLELHLGGAMTYATESGKDRKAA